ncbi:MAG: hypothetical protein MRZ34_03000 [Bacillales bacterium]|nr:hypothetical protein [Bacillales bacterium]
MKDLVNYNETLISIFSVFDGELKVLLLRKKTEPYKGYWILPGNLLRCDETIENNITDAVYDLTGLTNVYIEQTYSFSALDRNPDYRLIAISHIGLVDSTTVEIKREERENVESEWFKITDLPKLAFDHEMILNKNIKYLYSKIINSNILKILFPSDFTLPELQKVYEQVLDKPLDRRNFRKKFIALDLVEDTLEKNTGFNGRPAKLYRFKDDIKERNLF